MPGCWRCCRTSRVGATLGGVLDAAAVDAHIAGMDEHWREHGFGWYAFLDRETGALVARGGPHATRRAPAVIARTRGALLLSCTQASVAEAGRETLALDGRSRDG